MLIPKNMLIFYLYTVKNFTPQDYYKIYANNIVAVSYVDIILFFIDPMIQWWTSSITYSFFNYSIILFDGIDKSITNNRWTVTTISSH